MRTGFIVPALLAAWAWAGCDTTPIPHDPEAPAVTAAACQDGDRGPEGHAETRGHRDARVKATIECLDSCVQAVESLERAEARDHTTQIAQKEEKLAKRQAKCSALFDALPPEDQEEVLERAPEAYATCLGPDPCAEACGTFVSDLEAMCLPLGIADLCTLIGSSNDLCVAAMCPLDEAACSTQCSDLAGAFVTRCSEQLPDFGLCPLLAQVLVSQCTNTLCPPPPLTCDQTCQVEINERIQPCFQSGDPACYADVEAFARECTEGCCAERCDANRDVALETCAAPDAPPDCTAEVEQEHVLCLGACPLPASVCGDGLCDWFEPEYCLEDCAPADCWGACYYQFDLDIRSCDGAADPQACQQQAELDLQLCEWECCEADCGTPGCCGEPPTPPVCGNGICEAYELDTCPEDCQQQLCDQTCNAQLNEAYELCWNEPVPWGCIQDVENTYFMCTFGCCEAACGAPGCCGEPPELNVCGDGVCTGMEPEFCDQDCPAEACYRDCNEQRWAAEATCQSAPDYYACLQDVFNAYNACTFGCCELSCGEPGCCGEPPVPAVCGNGVCEAYEDQFCEADCPAQVCYNQCRQDFEAAINACTALPDPEPCFRDAEYAEMLCEHACCEAACGEVGCCGEPPPRPQVCGDGVCEPGEEGWCPDCPSVCGDGYCAPDELDWCEDCAAFCGNGICEPGEEEDGCPDCAFCGNGICEPGEEGWCPDCGAFCGDGVCDPDEEQWCPDCGDACGDGVCNPGEEGWCPDCGSFCGDGVCTSEEEGVCADCGPFCGDGVCTPGEEGWCAECP